MTTAPSQVELIATYKELLKGYLEKRPSGLRKRISDAIGTNRSFVSQITNPKYSVPIPSQYLHTLIAVCHLTPLEREEFLAAYLAAHPGQVELLQNGGLASSDSVTIDLSSVEDHTERTLIKETLKHLADSLISLANGKGRVEP